MTWGRKGSITELPRHGSIAPAMHAAAIEPEPCEWSAMREVYDSLRAFPESGQRRIIEAVQRRLHDEAVAERHRLDQED